MINYISKKVLLVVLATATYAINPTSILAAEETSSCSSCWSWLCGSSSHTEQRLLDHEVGADAPTSVYVPPEQSTPTDGQKNLSKQLRDLLSTSSNCSRAIQLVIDKEQGPGVSFDLNFAVGDMCELSINRNGIKSTLVLTFESN